MKKKTVFVELIPDDGNWLTQAELEDGQVRQFDKEVYCPSTQVDMWEEWTNEEKEAWEAEHPIEEPTPEGEELTEGEEARE